MPAGSPGVNAMRRYGLPDGHLKAEIKKAILQHNCWDALKNTDYEDKVGLAST